MRRTNSCLVLTAIVGLAVTASAQAPTDQQCKAVHADLVENRSEICKPGDIAPCFLGEIDGNHGLRGTTYFKGESSAFFPSGAPTFRSYVGNFEYTTATGTITMREMGMSEPAAVTTPDGGVVNAVQRVVSGTGEFEGATGLLFVSGFNRSGHILTTVHGTICTAR
jgi:hypothetical protein